MSYTIFHNLLIERTPLEVFNAVSQPHHLDNWWTLKSSGTPRLGETYNLNFTDDYNWFCKVSHVEAHKSIHFKMTQSDADWDPTSFGFDLEDHDKGTYLRFSHANWKMTNDHFKIASFCWAMLLNGLKNYLEKGIIIPFESRS